MNPLKDMLLNMLKVADYYNKCNPTAAAPLNECIAFYLSSSIPMISSVVRDMRNSGLIDNKTGRITPKGLSYIKNCFEPMNNGQLGNTVQDLFEVIMERVSKGASTLDFVVPRSEASYAFSEFATKWSEEYTPFVDCTYYEEDEQVDHLREEVEIYQYQQ
jgi:hypothetical protein